MHTYRVEGPKEIIHGVIRREKEDETEKEKA